MGDMDLLLVIRWWKATAVAAAPTRNTAPLRNKVVGKVMAFSGVGL